VLDADIAATRKQGYAVNPGRIIADMMGVGVPVWGRAGVVNESRVLAALSVAALRSRLSGARLHDVVAALQQAACATPQTSSMRPMGLAAHLLHVVELAGNLAVNQRRVNDARQHGIDADVVCGA